MRKKLGKAAGMRGRLEKWTITPSVSWSISNHEYSCREYSSNILRLEYSLLSTCKFPFPVAVFRSQLTNRWNLWQLGASRFHFATCQPWNKSE